MVAEFELAFTRCRKNLKTVQDLTVRNSLQDFDAIERYLRPKCQSVLVQKRRKLFYFQNFQVFSRCRFQNVPVRVPFSKSTVFKMCRQKMCLFRVNGRPIRHAFHHFQNVPASCERGLRQRLMRSYDADTFWKRWKMRWLGLPFTRKRRILCHEILKTVDFETGRFWKRNSSKRHNLKTASCEHSKKVKAEHFLPLSNQVERFFRRRYISFALNSWGDCNEFVTSKFVSFSNCAGIVWTLAQILLLSHFARFQNLPASCERSLWWENFVW